MKYRTLLTLIGAASLIAACSTVDLDSSSSSASSSGSSSSSSSLYAESANRCDADPAQSLIGETVSDKVEAEAKKLSGAAIVRTLRPRDVITMEYNHERVNIRVDDEDVVTSVGCG